MTLRTQIKAKIKKIEKQIFTLDTNKLNYYLTLNTEYRVLQNTDTLIIY